MENKKTILVWLGAMVWVCLCGHILMYPPPNFSVSSMLLLMTPWCRLQPSNGVSELRLYNETGLLLYILALAILWLTLLFKMSDDVTHMTKVAQQTKEQFEAERQQGEKTRESLIENAELLLKNVDIEYEHCAATIAANNETPGQLVGGEIEWATGQSYPYL